MISMSYFRKSHKPRLFLALFIAFLIGGFAYYAIEILWRGYSHIALWLCGALSLAGIFLIDEGSKRGIIKRALYSALLITAAELACGSICNLWLKMDIWSYEQLPLNLFGQICLPFFGLWFLLSFPAVGVCRLIRTAVGLHRLS